MGFFSFLEPQQQEGEIDALKREQREARAYKPQPQEAPSQAVKPDPATARRALVSDEDSTAKLESAALSKIKSALELATSNTAADVEGGNPDAGNAELLQVKDAMDRGLLKPNQLASDLDQILKKSKSLGTPGLAKALTSGLNDLRVAQQQRDEIQARSAGIPQAPEIPASVHDQFSREAMDKAKQLRSETESMGILGRDAKLREARQSESQAQSLGKLAEEKRLKDSEPIVEAPIDSAPVTRFMKGLGIDYEDLSLRMHAALNKVGIPKEQWDDPNVDTTAGIMRVMSELDPNRQLAGLIAKQLADAKKEDQAKAGVQKGAKSGSVGAVAGMYGEEGRSGSAEIEGQIGAKEQRMRDLYAELRQTPFMRTWPGVILYVLVGVLTQNPAFAARLIGGVGNRGAVDAELRGLQFDIRRLDQQLSRKDTEERDIRRDAASRLQRERDSEQNYNRDIEKMYLNHKLILERAKQGASTSNRPIVMKLEGDYNRVARQMSEAEKIMNNTWLPDDDPKKITASREYNKLKSEAQFLDQKLRALTEQMAPGTYTEAEAEATP